MRKNILIAMAIVAAGFTSCSNNNVIAEPEYSNPVAQTSFNIVEENEVTQQSLYDMSVGSMKKNLKADIYAAVDKAYEKATMLQLGNFSAEKTLAPLLYKTVRIEYTTLDQDSLPVKASALIVYPLLRKMNKVMLINHGTQMGFAMIPTKYT